MIFWREQFAMNMGILNARSLSWFNRFAEDILEPAVESIAGFLDQWHCQATMQACDEDRRTLHFALMEDHHLTVRFRREGFDLLECTYEYSLPDIGHVQRNGMTRNLRAVDADWVESCLQMALDEFLLNCLTSDYGCSATQPDPLRVVAEAAA